jgi:hypothetical protein
VNVTIANVAPKLGYWFDAKRYNTAFFECPRADLCDATERNSTCRLGYTEPLCFACASGFGRSVDAGDCTECPNDAIVLSFFALVTIAQIAFLVLSAHVSIRGARDAESAASVLVKVFLNTLQVNALAMFIALEWPEFLTFVLTAQKSVVSAVSGFYTIDCIFQLFDTPKVVFWMVMTFLSLIVVAIVCALYVSLLRSRFESKLAASISSKAASPVTASTGSFSFYCLFESALLCSAFMLHTAFSMRLVNIFQCVDVDDRGTRVLTADYSIECATPTHDMLSRLSGGGLMLLVAGIPIVALWRMHKHRHRFRYVLAQQYRTLL